MAYLCCTSDFNGDGRLSLVDYRLYYIWSTFVNHALPPAQQKEALQTLYALSFPAEAPVTVVNLPELDCSDYNDDLRLSVEDYRLYYLWDAMVDKVKPVAEQLAAMSALYTLAYPLEAGVVAVRRPEVLDPTKCAGSHGWFVSPWLESSGVPVGWFQ